MVGNAQLERVALHKRYIAEFLQAEMITFLKKYTYAKKKAQIAIANFINNCLLAVQLIHSSY